jgi:phage shock protein PspC (stress-responsive transcriptional regulator)
MFGLVIYIIAYLCVDSKNNRCFTTNLLIKGET